MNSMIPNKYTYLVGYYEIGEFWCVGEFLDVDEQNAKAAFEDLCKRRPHLHCELIQKITMNKVVEHFYPTTK